MSRPTRSPFGGLLTFYGALALCAVAALAVPRLSVVAGLVAVALLVVISQRQPAALCGLLVPAVAFGSLAQRALGPLRAGATDLLVGAMAAALILRAFQSRGEWAVAVGRAGVQLRARARAAWQRSRPVTALVGTVVAYLVVIVLSAAVAFNRSLVAKEAIKWAEVLVALLYAIVALRQPRQRAAVAWVIVATGVLEALIGNGQWVLATGSFGADGSTLRVFGTFAQPNPYAAYLNLATPFALAFALLHPRLEARWVAAGAGALLLFAQGLAGSRGGWLALAAALAVMAVAALRIEKPALAVGLPLAALGGIAWATNLLPAKLQHAALHALRLENVSLSAPLNDANFSSVERLAHWVAGGRMFLAHPILGVGAGNYDPAYARYAAPGWPDSLGHAHNYFINAAAETGAIGGLVFVALIVAAFWLAGRAVVVVRRAVGARPWRAGIGALWQDAAPDYAPALAVLGVVVAVTVQSFVDDVFVHAMELQLALCLGLAATILLRPSSEGA
ncbi:MAG TPA: O-antigen ligase family protein [Ktedonobacterales bacterium]|nr:O-antigen ligase family protein [Ktedonobacterales bacterium]